MIQIADCGFEGLKVLQACNSLSGREFHSLWGKRIFIAVPRGVDLPKGHGVAIPGNSIIVLVLDSQKPNMIPTELTPVIALIGQRKTSGKHVHEK